MSEIRRVAVVGAGTMGAGIAQVFAMAEFEASLFDLTNEQLERGTGAIRTMLAKGVSRGKVTVEQEAAALKRVSTTTDLASAVENADLVIEAVPEQMDIKRKVFTQITAACKPTTLLASNTSSLSITELASATDRPERFLGMHFFNPVPVMKLLEIVVGRETSDETLALARDLGERIGKTTIVVKDMPGFATSRLGIALGLEAIRMLQQGVASASDIDTAMELGYGHPMGPLKLTDLVGLDVRLDIARYLESKLGGDTFSPPELLVEMVGMGSLGKKTGRGFYDWTESAKN